MNRKLQTIKISGCFNLSPQNGPGGCLPACYLHRTWGTLPASSKSALAMLHRCCVTSCASRHSSILLTHTRPGAICQHHLEVLLQCCIGVASHASHHVIPAYYSVTCLEYQHFLSDQYCCDHHLQAVLKLEYQLLLSTQCCCPSPSSESAKGCHGHLQWRPS